MDQLTADFGALMKKCLLALLALALCSQAFAEIDEFKGDGYYWYRDPAAVEEEDKPATAPPPKPIAPEDIPMSVAWLQKNVEILRERAIDNPNQENVQNYAYAQRVLLDKSQQFAVMFNQVVKTDAFLDEENRVPTASYANVLFQRKANQGQKAAIDYMVQHGGLWLFVDSPDKCSACDPYKNSVIQALLKKYPFRFQVINVSTEQGMTAAKNIGLKLTPATVYAKPKDPSLPDSDFNKDSTYALSQGLLSLDMLEERMIIAANAGKFLPKNLEEGANPYQKDVLTHDDFEGLQLGDPSAVMKAFREKVNKK